MVSPFGNASTGCKQKLQAAELCGAVRADAAAAAELRGGREGCGGGPGVPFFSVFVLKGRQMEALKGSHT